MTVKTAEQAEGFSRKFGITILVIEVIMMVLYGTCTDYALHSNANTDYKKDTVLNMYGKFQDVHVMIFMGFGFLMTFLKKYGFSSVAFNFLISAIVIQVSILTNHFWHCIFADGGVHFVNLSMDITDLIKGDFAAGAAMISFGAILGKASPLELVFIAISEMMFYGMNENIGAVKLKAVDMGGSIFVHTFGAYFGLAVSYMITPAKLIKDEDEIGKDEGSTHNSDMFAMVGTIFLWMFWPSFNGALAAEAQQHRVIINTVLSLTASCVITFCMSAIFREGNKFDMVDIQNATLAGGVAVGSASDLVIGPWGAIFIGCIGGTVSVIGYTKIQPWLQENCSLHDTCGVHNLHGMPGLVGGIGGAITASIAGDASYGEPIWNIYSARAPAPGDARSAGEQGGFQFLALVITWAIACVSGLLVGFIVNQMRSSCDEGPANLFHDADYWHMPQFDSVQESLPLIADEIDQKVDTAAGVAPDGISIDMDAGPAEGKARDGTSCEPSC